MAPGRDGVGHRDGGRPARGHHAGRPGAQHPVHDARRVGEEVLGGRSCGAGVGSGAGREAKRCCPAGWRASERDARARASPCGAARSVGQGRPAARGGGGGQSCAAAGGQPAHPRRGTALLRERCLRDDRAPGAGGRGLGAQARSAEAQGEGQDEGPAQGLRARRAEPVVAIGPLHLPAAPARARLRRRLPGRPLALPREPGDGAPPEERARTGGARARHRRLRPAARDPHRPGAPVHRLARLDRVRRRTAPPGHPARQEPPAPPADLRQDRALLEDAVGGIALAHGVRRLRGLPAAGAAVRAALQLPAPAPGLGGPHSG